MRKVRCIDTGEVFDSVTDADLGSSEDVMKGRSMVCYACRKREPMADGSGIFWCSTCPVRRIDLSNGV